MRAMPRRGRGPRQARFWLAGVGGRCVLPEVPCHITQRAVDRRETYCLTTPHAIRFPELPAGSVFMSSALA
jgi:hypothetical protein